MNELINKLEQAGWTNKGNGFFLRPGRKNGISARIMNSRFFIFSAACGNFKAGISYDFETVLNLLQYGRK